MYIYESAWVGGWIWVGGCTYMRVRGWVGGSGRVDGQISERVGVG